MKQKVIRLTETDIRAIIGNITREYLAEMDGKTYARMQNFTHNLKDQNQSGSFSTTKVINNKTNGTRRFVASNNDDRITKVRKEEPTVQEYWLKDYIGKTFKFYGEDRLHMVADILFKFKRIKKLDLNKTILVGDVVYNDEEISGDGITIDFAKNKVQYHEKRSRYAYNLEIDIRSKTLWDDLFAQIKMAIDNTVKK